MKAVEKEKPDLILLDVMMPGIDGFEVCQLLKENPELADIPVIFISALDETDDIVKALSVGGVDYINKPFQAEEVKARVKTHLKLYQQNKELQQQSMELQKQSKELQALNADRDKFFSIIAHDLRGPLGEFMGLTEMMADKEQNFEAAEIQEMTEELSQAARQTFNLLENLLEWSQMGNGFIGCNPQKLELRQMVRECVNIVSETAHKKEIGIFVDITAEPMVFADKNMLKTVIRNLFSNAIKYTPNGGSVCLSTGMGEKNTVCVTVRDTGIGMNDELRKNLFQGGANIKRPGTQGETSTGLGLQLCKEFIEKQGGKIWVESEQDKGSAFNFTLPFLGNQEEKINKEKVAEPVNAGGQALKLNILIAEDDVVSAKLISIMVKNIGKEFYRVKNGTEAVEACRNNPDIDLVLMDIQMPGIDGLEAARQIRKFSGDVIIIAQTTYGQYGGRESALEAGCNDYIMKPYELETLNEMIKKHLSGKA